VILRRGRESLFSTDTAVGAARDGIKADVILKATRVTEFTTPTRKQIPDANSLAAISYREVLNQNLKVMDSTAISLCMDNACDRGVQHEPAGEHQAGGARRARGLEGDAGLEQLLVCKF